MVVSCSYFDFFDFCNPGLSSAPIINTTLNNIIQFLITSGVVSQALDLKEKKNERKNYGVYLWRERKNQELFDQGLNSYLIKN